MHIHSSRRSAFFPILIDTKGRRDIPVVVMLKGKKRYLPRHYEDSSVFLSRHRGLMSVVTDLAQNRKRICVFV